MQWPIHPFPELQTQSFRLRKMSLKDAPEIFNLRSDERINEFLDRPKATSLDDAKKFIRKINTGIEESDWLYWGIQSDKSEKLIGTICFWNVQPDKAQAEIGFELMHEHQGKGVMSEVVKAFLKFGFESIKLKRIDAVIHPNNIRSASILEKFGFKKSDQIPEGSLPEEKLVLYMLMR